MTRRHWILSGVVIGLALLLAFPLRPFMERTFVTPISYALWLLGLFYNTAPQVIWWGVGIILVALIALGTIMPEDRAVHSRPPESKPIQGPVEGLSIWIKKTEGGIYYKWLVAHRLGKLAFRMLVQREGGKARSIFAPLTGADWQPDDALRNYLEIGLHGSFADYPGSSNPLKPARRTPLDLEIRQAVEFLEANSEVERGRHL